MANQKKQSGGSRAEKGYQPVPGPNRGTGDTAMPVDNGYQPNRGNLDVSNPPKGGSGFPKPSGGDSSTSKDK
jgi:hypothetical protein